MRRLLLKKLLHSASNVTTAVFTYSFNVQHKTDNYPLKKLQHVLDSCVAVQRLNIAANARVVTTHNPNTSIRHRLCFCRATIVQNLQLKSHTRYKWRCDNYNPKSHNCGCI